jgi:peptidoglycan/xylan/chitin deacetylase (PgdA/CDA1 family)
VWIAIVLSLVVITVGTWITALSLRLRALSAEEAAAAAPPLPYAVGELRRRDDRVVVTIQGSPNATVVLLADKVPVRILDLDDKGRGIVDTEDIGEDAALSIAVLADPPESVPPLPTSTPTTTASPTPSRTVTPSPTPTRGRTRTEAAPPTPTPLSISRARGETEPARSPAATPAADTTPVGRQPAGGDETPRAAAPPVLHLVTDAGPRIAITFDGNASSNGTAELLAMLQELDLQITLFVTGGFIERYPTLVRQAVLAGHEVGNHTFSHPHLTTYARNRRHDLSSSVTRSSFRKQLRRTEEAFRRATGRPMAPLWRAPFGEENPRLRSWALEMGYLHVRWSSLEGASLDSLDWIADEHSKLYRDSRNMIDRLLGFPRLEGGIVLMHLSTERSEPPWSELPRFVSELRERELETVKVSELLRASPTWRGWLERARKRHNEIFGE